jgi:hypothetical protein
MPRLKLFSVYDNLSAGQRDKFRGYTADHIAAFRKSRPDVQLNIDGKEYPAGK